MYEVYSRKNRLVTFLWCILEQKFLSALFDVVALYTDALPVPLSSHFWKAAVNADVGSILQTHSHSVWTLSSLMWTPEIAAFTVGKSQKSAGARSGKYRAWSRVLMFLLSKVQGQPCSMHWGIVPVQKPLSSSYFGSLASKNA